MAVIDSLLGVKVSIRLNGSKEDCAEYDDPKPPQTPASCGAATHSISKIIESQDDTNFSVHYEFKDAQRWLKSRRGLGVAIYVDGNFADGNYVRSTLSNEAGIQGQVFRGCIEGKIEASTKPGKDILKPFKFTKIIQVEEGGARVTEDLKVVKHLGNIEIIIYRAEIRGHTDWKPDNITSKTELAEKAMKGKNFFSEERDVPKFQWLDCTYPDGSVRLARFIFRYKSKTALQIEGILPREPSPESSPETQPRNAADLPHEELQKLAQERLDQLAMVKLESKVGVKREADDEINSRMPKVYKMTTDGAIDLTE
ncbi:hypothetical protein CSUB01_00690 [Colletotrichum sublineola]|uniref:DUF7918 domain-containing protein n=1 Tax=Colletotrichum sublineola TaxID=1173701 RepID=A0A066XEE8_COLSU|nr:hypothetical protein CSUB01_00690 [Colletotrichum sublineola]